MKLTELEPEFLKLLDAQGRSFRSDATFADCDGLLFLCPKCWCTNHGPVGTHSVICWKPHVPPAILPEPGRWRFAGTGIKDLSLSPSVRLGGGCDWHGWIRNGEVMSV